MQSPPPASPLPAPHLRISQTRSQRLRNQGTDPQAPDTYHQDGPGFHLSPKSTCAVVYLLMDPIERPPSITPLDKVLYYPRRSKSLARWPAFIAAERDQRQRFRGLKCSLFVMRRITSLSLAAFHCFRSVFARNIEAHNASTRKHDATTAKLQARRFPAIPESWIPGHGLGIPPFVR